MSVILLCGGRRGGRRGGRTWAAAGCDAGAGECEGLRREADAVTVLPSHCTLLTLTSSAPASSPALMLRSENSAAPENTPCAAGCGTPCATKAFSCSAIACVHAWKTLSEPRTHPPSRDAWVWPAAAEGQVSARRSSIFGAGPAVGAGVPGRAGREETAENRAPGGAREPLLILPDRKSFDHQLDGRASFLGAAAPPAMAPRADGSPPASLHARRIRRRDAAVERSRHDAEMSRLALTTSARRVASSQRLPGLRVVWRQSGGGRTGARPQQ